MNSYLPISCVEAEKLLCKLDNSQVALLGDMCLDMYLTADMKLSELSRETPHYPLPIVSERVSPGGAANVAANISALCPKRLTVIGVIGTDWRGNLLTNALAENNIDTLNLIRDSRVQTNTYIKTIRTGISQVTYEDPRIDIENRVPMPEDLEEVICRRLKDCEFDVLLVSDQMKYGCVTKKVRECICQLGAEGKKVIVDSRIHIGEYHHVVIKPNEVEAQRAFSNTVVESELHGDTLLKFAENELPYIKSITEKPVIITLGSLGSICIDNNNNIFHIPAIKINGSVDIVGAGDTFLAALGTMLASGCSLYESIQIATYASGVTVQKIGTTGTASRSEIINQIRSQV